MCLEAPEHGAGVSFPAVPEGAFDDTGGLLELFVFIANAALLEGIFVGAAVFQRLIITRPRPANT